MLAWRWLRGTAIAAPWARLAGGLAWVGSTCTALGLFKDWRPIAGADSCRRADRPGDGGLRPIEAEPHRRGPGDRRHLDPFAVPDFDLRDVAPAGVVRCADSDRDGSVGTPGHVAREVDRAVSATSPAASREAAPRREPHREACSEAATAAAAIPEIPEPAPIPGDPRDCRPAETGRSRRSSGTTLRRPAHTPSAPHRSLRSVSTTFRSGLWNRSPNRRCEELRSSNRRLDNLRRNLRKSTPRPSAICRRSRPNRVSYSSCPPRNFCRSPLRAPPSTARN